MRILHLNHNGTIVGGVEKYIVDVAAALKERGHQSRLAHFQALESEDKQTEVINNSVSIATDNWKRELLATVVDFQADVALMHVVYNPEIVRWLALHLPSVAYIHSPYIVCPGYGQYLKSSGTTCQRRSGPYCLVNAQLERCCYGRSPIRHIRRLLQVYEFINIYRRMPLLVNSGFMRDLLVRNSILVDKRSILPPILINHVEQIQERRTQVPKILFVGRLVPEKGLRYLIEALTTVDQEWNLIVVGEGPERESLIRLVRSSELANRVIFSGWCSEKDLNQHYSEAAIVAVPSIWPEPFGRVGPEAAAHGKPTVAFDVGGVREWLDDGVTGLLAQPANTVHLGSCLQDLLSNPSKRRRLGSQAYHNALERWDADSHVNQLVAVLSRAITRGRVFEKG